jgi:hypothetical protein
MVGVVAAATTGEGVFAATVGIGHGKVATGGAVPLDVGGDAGWL